MEKYLQNIKKNVIIKNTAKISNILNAKKKGDKTMVGFDNYTIAMISEETDYPQMLVTKNFKSELRTLNRGYVAILGNVFNSKYIGDGEFSKSPAIKSIEGKCAITESGAHILLGNPSNEYNEFIKNVEEGNEIIYDWEINFCRRGSYEIKGYSVKNGKKKFIIREIKSIDTSAHYVHFYDGTKALLDLFYQKPEYRTMTISSNCANKIVYCGVTMNQTIPMMA